MKKLEICYPNYSKKAITFTMDDGNIPYDTKLLSILSPVGMKGTFNLTGCNLDKYTTEEYREVYQGQEIANHCKMHPYCLPDSGEYIVADEPFDHEHADEDRLYHHPLYEGLYYTHLPRGWRLIAHPDTYCALIDIAKAEIEMVFGGKRVRDFVWPFGEQSSSKVMAHFAERGYRSVRRTGCMGDSEAFAIPQDYMHWSYNANHLNLLEVAALYEKTPDDGELKMFAFGVHSVDFERAEKWDDLSAFAAIYGNRPHDFWYATVGEIFDYAAAARRVKVDDGYVENNSETTIYLKLDDVPLTLAPGCKIRL